VRRVSAQFLLLVISLSLTTPLLLADSDSKIAACCRRDGKHHCAKMAGAHQVEDSAGTVRVTAKATCPLFNGGKAAPAVAGTAVAPPSFFESFALAIQIAKAPQAEAQGRISKSRSSQKRGPPALLA